MYENMTYEYLLAEMLRYAVEQAEKREEKLDTREGSMLWYGQAPAAVEAQNLFIQLDTILKETFAHTASRPYLLLRAKERGLSPKPASCAIGRAIFAPPELEISVGERFSLDDLNYAVTEKITAGEKTLGLCPKPHQGSSSLGTHYTGAYAPARRKME